MNYFLCVLLLLICEVSWSESQQNTRSSYIDSIKDKDDIWIWGYSDTVDNRNTEETHPHSAEFNDTKNPCDPFVLIKPNFTGRISEIKCQEQIWQLKYDAEKLIHESNCETNAQNEDNVGYGKIRDVPQVIGGRLTFPGEYPHMGAIGWRGIEDRWLFKCGCILISHNFVLTAAHCSSASAADTSITDTEPKIVRLMAKNLLRGPVNADVGILRIIVHPNYKPPKKYYDIALMKLDREIEYNHLAHPACLWTKPDLKEINSTTVTGWGVLKENSLILSNELRAGDVDLIEESVCNQLLNKFCNRNWCGLTDHQFCAGKLIGGVDACQGDSGGPLQMKIPLRNYVAYKLYYVFGVTSFGVGCAQPKLPGIYSKVSSFLDWIEPIVWP